MDMELNLDDFKAAWQKYEQKLDANQQSMHHILAIVQRNRSRSTLDKMIREIRLPGVILFILVWFFVAVIAGNAFDYTDTIQYVPAGCYVLIAATGFYFLMKHLATLRRTTLPTHDLRQALITLIQLRIRHSTLMKWVWILAMLAGSMIMLPTVVRRFASNGWLYTGLIVGVPIVITSLSVGLASLAGMFKDRYLVELRAQVDELDESPQNR
ncbi:hypothetical protein IC229_06460 [Spirosoma sp. BT702]|uniref:Uncharacterized protein n=1 Tax=Spirosoma profusum TaxID=2771354 RepID=A0A926XU80_9BACT|nr:hypothetical protein [Spirosoma profusum]MBD2700267.1 hypothetical protein [Spirosoma profusum]